MSLFKAKVQRGSGIRKEFLSFEKYSLARNKSLISMKTKDLYFKLKIIKTGTINGELHLIVPVQREGAVTPSLAKYARDRGVPIIDPNGTVYNPE